jgi:hypothetical protein
MNYDVYGPFEISKTGKDFAGDAIKEFWETVEDYDEGLSYAVGIYIFSIRHGETYTPWYVGKTNAKLGFRGEVFQTHKLDHYLTTTQQKRGCPIVHLIPKIEPVRGNFANQSDKAEREIDALETALIGMALRANPKVRNEKKTWFIRNCYVPGVLGKPIKGRRPEGVSTIRKVFKL